MKNIAPLPHWYRPEPKMPKRRIDFGGLVMWAIFTAAFGVSWVVDRASAAWAWIRGNRQE